MRLSGQLASDLSDYARCYRECYGQAIELNELAAEILGQFVASDRAFRRWQRSHRRGELSDAGKGHRDPG